jgi:hypothetical protein
MDAKGETVKRTVIVLAAMMLLPAIPAEAKTKNARPRVHIGPIVESFDEPGGNREFAIPIHAVDPDGFISEIAVDFGDGVVLFMLLVCDPETGRPGDPVTQEITWSYAPGSYTIRAQAFSTPRCFEGEFQESRFDHAKLKVR